ncbi:aldehyde dehydrogenase family protein [Paraflavitalea speifideaquila]|uniref:aldehyde dehydrogenase family protein n=1 Tax=Paraflavitalea speifideaquila TaxID=3076558 RepID=UPI0028E4B447|nr:aldehyde dehydrogenase family protein [Paraflavitalea speifideiaquila]
MFKDATIAEINGVMENAWKAFHTYRKLPIKQRANLMRAIATGLDNAPDELISTAMQETNLPEARLRNEKARTVFQLNSYAEACEKGSGWKHELIRLILTERHQNQISASYWFP